MMTSLLLAAGESRRMGRPKALLLMPDGESFLGEASRAVQSLPLSARIAVVGEALSDVLKTAPHHFSGVVTNHSPQLGQLHSVKLGLAHLAEIAPESSGTLIHLVDNPGHLVDRMGMVLAQVERSGGGMLIAAAFRGEPGHPLWLPRRLWQGVRGWQGPEGLRGFLTSSGEAFQLVETGLESTHWDIDTPEAYRQLLHPAPD
ncbi:NTP transferase domain-containing protein [Candidatus Sumerlaeota bacterium]|nr:NTP transferase domain-containing protein [Candidatus Sumerlaeota bacterium]